MRLLLLRFPDQCSTRTSRFLHTGCMFPSIHPPPKVQRAHAEKKQGNVAARRNTAGYRPRRAKDRDCTCWLLVFRQPHKTSQNKSDRPVHKGAHSRRLADPLAHNSGRKKTNDTTDDEIQMGSTYCSYKKR